MAKQAPAIPIWAADASGLDPKRSHRFILNLSDVPAYFVKTSRVPELTIKSDAKHQFLGHTFKFPGSATWSDSLEVVLVDTIDYNMAEKFISYLRTAGYIYPSQWSTDSGDPQYFKKTIAKNKFPFKQMKLERIDADGKAYESWVLNNCFITKVNFGDHGYDKEDLINVTVSITFDWAEYRDAAGNVPAFPK
jgi:hypothetical protein